MTLKIRPFEANEADYEAMIAIDSAVFADYPMSVDEWRHIDETRDPTHLFLREMIELEGKIVAFGDYGQTTDPKTYAFHVFVHPNHEHPNIRPAYLSHVLAIFADHKAQVLSSGALDDHPEDVAFLEQHGFQVVMREESSELDVTAFDPEPFRHIMDNVHGSGINILSLRELATRDRAWRQRLHDLFWILIQDVPSPVPHVRRSLDEFIQVHLSGPEFSADSWFVALDGNLYVGMCRARLNQVDPRRLDSGLTGVVPSYRRRKIATALKLHLIDYAHQTGITSIMTFNEAGNPMYQLNQSLGFMPRPAWVTYEKRLAVAGSIGAQ